jgi:hypothetical protein
LFKIANFQEQNVKIAEIWALCANYVLLFGTCTPNLPTPNQNPGSAPDSRKESYKKAKYNAVVKFLVGLEKLIGS